MINWPPLHYWMQRQSIRRPKNIWHFLGLDASFAAERRFWLTDNAKNHWNAWVIFGTYMLLNEEKQFVLNKTQKAKWKKVNLNHFSTLYCSRTKKEGKYVTFWCLFQQIDWPDVQWQFKISSCCCTTTGIRRHKKKVLIPPQLWWRMKKDCSELYFTSWLIEDNSF